MQNRSLRAPSGRNGRTFPNSRFRPNQSNRRKGGFQGSYINPTKFVNKAAIQADQPVFVPVNTFADFGFSAELERNLARRNYITPTAIQDGAITAVMEGKDLIGLANTGTGKTAAFVLPIIQQLQQHRHPNRVLIMAPTRELAIQIDDEFRAFAAGLGLYSAMCVGGVAIGRQISQLNRRPHVVIGTPGRLKDLVNRGSLNLSQTDILVLDEADRMLDMGFVRDIRFLIGKLPAKRQSLCFSATVTPEIKVLMDDLLQDPVLVSVRVSETSEHVEQDVIKAASAQEKIQVLNELLRKPEFDKVLIFGQTKRGVQHLADRLTKEGLPAEAIHGNKSQSQRQRALKAFKSNEVAVLVATDVAARGLDIPNVSHVINYDQPNTYEDYIHRIGRTGRAGNSGHALTFIS